MSVKLIYSEYHLYCISLGHHMVQDSAVKGQLLLPEVFKSLWCWLIERPKHN